MSSSLKESNKVRRALVERAAERLNHVFQEPVSENGVPRPAASIETFAPRPAAEHQQESAQEEVPPQKSAYVDLERLRKLGFWVPNGSRRLINEELRVIKLNALQLVSRLEREGSEKANVIMVTSGGADEGKTFTAINLALSIAAEKDYDALLVDTDPGRAGVLEVLGLTADLGLVDVLEDPKRDIESVILHTNVEGLSVLPAGRHHPLGPELLASNRMRLLLSDLAVRNRRQIIVLDSFPVLAASEPSVLAKYTGQIVFVVGANQATTAATSEALSIVKLCPNVGFVLNKASKHYAPGLFGLDLD